MRFLESEVPLEFSACLSLEVLLRHSLGGGAHMAAVAVAKKADLIVPGGGHRVWGRVGTPDSSAQGGLARKKTYSSRLQDFSQAACRSEFARVGGGSV